MRNFLLKGSVLFLVLVGLLFIVVTKIKKDYSKEKQSGQIIREGESCINKSNQIDLIDVSLDKLVKDEDGLCYEYDEKRVVFNGNTVSQIFFSPTKEKVGFMENRNYNDENVPYERQIVLYAGNVRKKDFKEIFHGSIKTSGWEWFGDNEVAVYCGCGTECQVIYLINVNSGEKNILAYGVGYEWSPSKELVLAYHYSRGYGITVGNKNGKELLSIVRNYNSGENENLTDKTKAIWSPDSSKLALIIRKENKNQMELLVFDVTNNFKQIFKQDVSDADDYDLGWSEDGEDVRLNNAEIAIQ